MVNLLVLLSFSRLVFAYADDASVGFDVAKGQRPPDMQVELMTPHRVADDRGPGGVGGTFVKYPWSIRDVEAEGRNGDGLRARDGVEVAIGVSPFALPPNTVAGLYVGLFSFSLIGPEQFFETWMDEGSVPPPHNPLRLWTMFTSQFKGKPVQPDELGDSCIGEFFRGELCARVTSCLLVAGDEQRGGGIWKVALPAVHATNFRVEVYLGEPVGCDERGLGGTIGRLVPWWAPPIAAHAVQSRSAVAKHAAFARFRMLAVNTAAHWWAESTESFPAESWAEMMSAVLDTALVSPAANPDKHGLYTHDNCRRGLWLEFGVGSGKTTAAIGHKMNKYSTQDDDIILHGFDSFEGLPASWDHTKLGVGTFTMGGQIPEHLNDQKNLQIHVGLFSSTLSDLDIYQSTPIPFAHIDVDLYSSAIEVLSRIACQLYPGSALLFDELVNYEGFELGGEFKAWEYISTIYQIGWEYSGLYWQQAVPVIITHRGTVC